ncbi:MAG: DUF4173 domain-containing protein [Candidatus Hydrogenedentes bacterium]|nr:DUF4173 domain-containing protein [Candidatus Hydrogenedentota bacterium]
MDVPSKPGDAEGSPQSPHRRVPPHFPVAPPVSYNRYRPLRHVRRSEILALVVLTALLDYLIYCGAGGLSFALALLIIPIAVLAFAPVRRFTPALGLVLTLFPLLALHHAWQSDAAGIAVGVGLLVVLALVCRYGRAHIPFLALSFLPTAVAGIVRWIQYIGYGRRRGASFLWRRIEARSLAVIAVPVAIMSAFVLVFLGANPILRDSFNSNWKPLWDMLSNLWEKSAPTPERFLFWLIALVFVASLFRPQAFLYPGHRRWLIPAVPKPAQELRANLSFRIARNTLLGVNVVFLGYNLIDAYYLAYLRELPTGLDHSQYAHQGVIGLTVALAMSTCVLGYAFSGELQYHPRANRLRNASYIWVAQNLLIAVWVMLRLHMYISYNGLTRMRVVGICGTLLVLCGVILVCIMIVRKRSIQWLLRKELAAFVLAIFLFTVLPVDWIVWRVNTPLILRMDPPRPAVQLSVQPISAEGLMILTPLLNHEDPAIARGVAALLGEWYEERGHVYTGPEESPERWTKYQFSEAQCARAILPHLGKIRELIPDSNWGEYLHRAKHRTSGWI